MSTLICKGCGGTTNTTTCDYLEHKDRQPRTCFIKWENGEPVKGCGLDNLLSKDAYGKWYKEWCMHLLKKKVEKKHG